MTANSLTILGQMFYEPGKAFEALREHSRPWLPLLLLSVLTAAIMYWYFSTVDFAWLVERMVAASGKPEAAEAIRKSFTLDAMRYGSAGGALVGTLFVYALSALYFLLAAKVLGSDIGYGKWFGFTAWTSVPRLLTLPLMALQIVSGHGKVAMEDLNMLSLNYLVFHLPPSNPWAGLLGGVDLTSIWCLVLSIIGLKVWTKCSQGAAIIVGVLPMVLIYGTWAAKIHFMG